MQSHEHFMRLALEQAQIGEALGEIPVGAVLTLNGDVVAVGHNQTISKCDPTAHAEIVAIRAAAQALGNYRLAQCVLYVTLEPCAMCMGAVLHSRISKLYFGTSDPKTGACGSVLNIPAESRINHHCEVHAGILQTLCAQHLTAYFRTLRSQKSHSARVPMREDALRLDFRSLRPLVPKAVSMPVDDLQASEGLRVQVWSSPQAAPSPSTLILCLHGATSWSYIYGAFLAADMPPDVVAWAVDLPGHGGSDKTKKGAELLDTALQLRVLIELLGRVKSPGIHVIAQDSGGTLAIRLAREMPKRIVGLTLINPVCADYNNASEPPPVVRSRQQFADYIATVSDGDQDVSRALCAPYPDAGHMAGLLSWFRQQPVVTSSACAGSRMQVGLLRCDVHVGTGHIAKFVHFQAKFGLTFEVSEHASTSLFLGLKSPSIWNGVLRQINANG